MKCKNMFCIRNDKKDVDGCRDLWDDGLKDCEYRLRYDRVMRKVKQPYDFDVVGVLQHEWKKYFGRKI